MNQRWRTMRPTENRNFKDQLTIYNDRQIVRAIQRSIILNIRSLYFQVMFYYPSLTIACDNTHPFLVFYLSSEYNSSFSFPNYAIQSKENHQVAHTFNSKLLQAGNSSLNAEDQSEAKFCNTSEQPMKEASFTHLAPSESRKYKKMRLNFRVKWCNQYRNIVPNLINQLMSFLLKRAKSQKIIRKFFTKLALSSKCTIGRFYLYMRGMRDSFSHYLNEAVLTRFFELQEPNLQVYSYEEQTSYMKVCRLAVQHFLNHSLLLTLICSKMQPTKKQLHLVGRRALLDKFHELASQNQ